MLNANTIFFAEYPTGYHFADSLKELADGFTKLGNPNIQISCKITGLTKTVGDMSTNDMNDVVKFIYGEMPTDDFMMTRIDKLSNEERELAFT